MKSLLPHELTCPRCQHRLVYVPPFHDESVRDSPRGQAMTNITVDEAVSAIRRDYYTEVLELARDLAERMKAGEVDDFGDALHEQCDGCARVIYTFQAKLGLLASDNEDAAAEEMGEEEARAMTPEARCYYALCADIRERLEAGDVDLNDPDSWAEIDLEGFAP